MVYDVRGSSQFTVGTNVSCQLHVGYNVTEPPELSGHHQEVTGCGTQGQQSSNVTHLSSDEASCEFIQNSG